MNRGSLVSISKKLMFYVFGVVKRGSLLGNEELALGGDSPIFEIIYPNLEQRSIFAKKSTHLYVSIKIFLK